MSNGYNWFASVSSKAPIYLSTRRATKMTIEIRNDGKTTNLSAFERKMARQRPGLISQSVLDAVAREHGAFFLTSEKKSSSSPNP